MPPEEPDGSAPAPLERRDPVVVSESELIPQSSVDFELERVLNRLELLYRSLQESRALPESTAACHAPLLPSDREYAQNPDRRRATISLFSSRIRTRERREFVIGLSFSISSTLGFFRNGSGRNHMVLIGSMAAILAGFWLGAHHLTSTAGAGSIHRREPAAAAAPSSPNRPVPVEPAGTVDRVSAPGTAVSPAANKETARTEARQSPPPKISEDSRPEEGTAEVTLHSPVQTAAVQPVRRSPESLKAIRKLTSQAQNLRDPGSFGADPDPEPEYADSSSGLQEPPVPTLKVIPAYPDEAKSANINGDVEMLVSVDAQGNVTHVEAVSGPPELREAAMDAMLRWRFKPATIDGVKARGTGRFTISFRP